ncbi:DUF3558 family protein [Saccharopolyspora sp. NPDC050642]|uniref:DUF3558 family protein n=1 Tax=Saccharopolyspora sp. NPDC050642 TaxID=3157099 RepID=UPI0033E93951
MTKSVIAGALALLAMGVAGCGSSGTGGTGDGSGETGESASPTSNAAAAIDPCEMLKSADTAKLGVKGPGTPKRYAGAPGCDFKLAVGGISVVVNSDKSVDELNLTGGKVDAVSVAGVDGKRVRELVGPGDCGVFFPLSPKESIAINATARDTEAACQATQEAAPLVLANLPKN